MTSRSKLLMMQWSLCSIVFVPIAYAELDNPVEYTCGTSGNFTLGDTYQTNLNTVLTAVAADSNISYGFYNFSFGKSPDTVNTIALCRGDLNPADCRACITAAAYKLTLLCPVQMEAITWYEYCMLRYSNRGIFGSENDDGYRYTTGSKVVSNVEQFSYARGTLLKDLKTRAAGGDSLRKFAVGTSDVNVSTIYGLVQCTPDLVKEDCISCLDYVIGSLSRDEVSDGETVLAASCLVRYEIYRFYNASSDAPPPSPLARSPTANQTIPVFLPVTSKERSSISTAVIIIIGVLVAALCLLIAALCMICLRMKTRKPWERVETGKEITPVESLQYDFRTIKTATNNFSDQNKLGQGGFGIVYKGTLANGQDIAVKKLLADSVQGDVQFRNELVLVAKLQHRNLVKLLGFCLEEKLLVYEYVPNKSLDYFLFDPDKRSHLNWETRSKIIGGIARGLLYLHEDSRLRIIHRDLKASNILLDEELNPKISDFGLARLFMVNQTQAATSKIMGTYGYMAPEYAMQGQFSAKSDVFSFGVLILEIISGRRNTTFLMGETTKDLLSFAWQSWQEGMVSNLIDPTLRDGMKTEILRCIQIGLLAVQEDIDDRPTMASVVVMLNSYSIAIPVPSRPAIVYRKYIGKRSETSSSMFQNSRDAYSEENRLNHVEASSVDTSRSIDLYPR